MKLSLSTPLPSLPDSPGPAPAKAPATSAPADGTGSAADSTPTFDSLLPHPPAPRKPATDKVSDEAAQAAAQSTAALWQPQTPPAPLPVAPLVTGAGPTETGPGAESSAVGTMLGATLSPRSFTLTPTATKTDPTLQSTPLNAGSQPLAPITASFSFTPPSRPASVPAPATPISPMPAVPAPALPGFPVPSAPMTTAAVVGQFPAASTGPTAASAATPAKAPKPAAAGVTQAMEDSAAAPAGAGSPMAPRPPGLAADAVPFSTGEKNAAVNPTLPANSFSQDNSGKKEFLSSGPETLNPTGAKVGTDVAEGSVAMPAVSAPRSKPATAATAAPVMSIEPSAGRNAAASPAAAAAPVATVRETMAAVLSAVDAFEHQAAGQKSVDFQFNVGGQQLGLHLELRDGTVHTTFHTDSPELRSALAHEWQSVAQPAATRDLRLAEPVFNSTTSGGDAAFSSPGRDSSQSGEQPPARAAATDLTSESAPTEPPTARATETPSLTTQLLHAFA